MSDGSGIPSRCITNPTGRIEHRRWSTQAAETAISVFQVHQAANESPSTTELADRQHQFIAALLQGKVDSVVFRVNDAKKPGVAEILSASATIENLAIQEHADVVAVAEVELFHLIAVGIDAGPRIGPSFQAEVPDASKSRSETRPSDAEPRDNDR